MKPFSLLVDFDVIEFVGKLSRKEQAEIRRRLLKIREYPHNSSNDSELDPIGRTVQINLSGKYALKYWIDSADRHIKVLDIVPSHRRI